MGENDQMISKADAKRSRMDYAIRKQKVKMFVWIALILAVVGGAVFGVVMWNVKRVKNLPGVFIPDQGREHVGPGHVHTYNSNPPTSCPHFAKPANWGVYQEE